MNGFGNYKNQVVDELIDAVLKREGGKSNRVMDRGGPTNRGITLKTLQAWFKRQGKGVATQADLWALDEAETRQIYRVFYFEDPGIDCIRDYHLLELMFDSLIQHPPKKPIEWLQLATGVAPDGVMGPLTCNAVEAHGAGFLYGRVLFYRLRYYAQIVEDKPLQVANLVGWINRMQPFIERVP